MLIVTSQALPESLAIGKGKPHCNDKSSAEVEQAGRLALDIASCSVTIKGAIVSFTLMAQPSSDEPIQTRLRSQVERLTN
jgi:ATP-dependent protease HslVU (ClpYQ) peptidase subunit